MCDATTSTNAKNERKGVNCSSTPAIDGCKKKQDTCQNKHLCCEMKKPLKHKNPPCQQTTKCGCCCRKDKKQRNNE